MTKLEQILEEIGTPRLLVVGDFMLDRFAWGEAERVSPEAPALVLRCQREEARPGGAASVAAMARALGGRVRVAGVVGDDEDGWQLGGLLREAGIDTEGITTDPLRPTTLKQRFLGRTSKGPAQQLLRLDRESRTRLHPIQQRRLIGVIQQQIEDCDIVLVADHGKGVCGHELLGDLFEEATRRGLPVLVDPARGADFVAYRGAELLLPNREEAAHAGGQAVATREQALAAAREMIRRYEVHGVLVKLDADGMALAIAEEPDRLYPVEAREVRDVTGAGDMVLAVLGLCRASGMDFDDSVRLASVAAGLEVGRSGAATVSRTDLRLALAGRKPAAEKRISVEGMATLAESYRRQGGKVVVANGCFDLLHAGHAAYLEEAAALGDVLVVAVNDDPGVRRIKGEGRPVVGQSDRAALLAALACVDYVVIFSGETPHEVLRQLRPDVLVKGGDYAVDEVIGREVVEGYGGKVCVTGLRAGLTTTKVLAAVRRQLVLAEA